METVYDKTISIRTSVLFDVLNKLGYPSPEDLNLDDWGPWGPSVRKILVGAIFGPIPDPWIVQGIAKSLHQHFAKNDNRGNHYPESDEDWGAFGPYIYELMEKFDPQPIPWFALHMADIFIESVIELDNIAQVAPNFEDAIYGGITSELSVFVEECSTQWPGWWKRKLKKQIPPSPLYDRPSAIDLVVLGTKFHDFAASMDDQHYLKPIFVEAAENLLEQGLGRLS